MAALFKRKPKPRAWVQKEHDFVGLPNDIIILVMGPTGVGMNTSSSMVPGQIPVHLRQQAVEASLGLGGTPGFDDSRSAPDIEILTRVSEWLARVYSSQVPVTGIVYIHNILINWMYRSTKLNLSMFTKLYGEKSYKKVVIATSHWPAFPEEAPYEKKEERIHPLLIQKEVVDLERSIPETEAGQELRYTLQELVNLQRAEQANALDEVGKRELAGQISLAQKQIKQLRMPLSEWFKSLSLSVIAAWGAIGLPVAFVAFVVINFLKHESITEENGSLASPSLYLGGKFLLFGSVKGQANALKVALASRGWCFEFCSERGDRGLRPLLRRRVVDLLALMH
ncbi:hypothetical protein BKA70DRAFT_1225277 [Coprinopsis sp. MPI-PUGE-AT-0042]|nr:hypothetical protein BKA70DRAFT_1225277 [Coprinopsis sp. MPI-PUGE-AT-0042]